MISSVNLSVTTSHVPCCVCRSVPTVLFQMDGNDCEDYIGRFLCRKHLNQLRREFMQESRWPKG